MGRYVLGAFVGALIAAIAFEIVLHAANLEITDKNPSSNVTAFNLISNASGDSGTTDWGSGSGNLTVVPSNKPGVVGTKVFRLTPDSGTKTTYAYAPTFNVQPDEPLTASAYLVSVPSPGSARISIDWKNANGVYIVSSTPGEQIKKSGTRASVSATAPKRAHLATVIVNLFDAKPGSALEFDGVVAEPAAR